MKEEPIFCRLSIPLDNEFFEDFYENQWKSKAPGHNKYIHSPISIQSQRPAFSTVNGDQVLPKSQIMPPNPLWTWTDDWHLDCSFNNENGWIYLEDWKSSIQKTENSTKFRFRRWIRTRIYSKVSPDLFKHKDVISFRIMLSVNLKIWILFQIISI